ncbi:HAD-IIIC family phosphatase [Methylocella sp.]|uniref:HAD-IIIC family phosphatase n=1 Tax=Methylocella sp. TaxID=1978226 RepID=UPI0037852D1A
MDWLPRMSDWSAALREAQRLPWRDAKPVFIRLANADLDFLESGKLDRAAQRALDSSGAEEPRLRIAVLGSSTTSHLASGIRVGALRRGLVADVYEGPYGLYRQELMDPASGLRAFNPQIVLFALDARHVAGAEGVDPKDAVAQMATCWALAKSSFECAVVQQTLLPAFPATLGSNEHRLAESPFAVVETINGELRPAADAAGVQLLALDHMIRRHGGLDFWHDPALWNRAKQEISPRAAPLYGEYFGRLVAALRGLSAKCLVLDLDNTLWGGVIGDDGLEGIVLGQGSAAGEAYLDFQRYAKSLTRRGIILAVCSKNDEANALAPFREHPEMLLKESDIACFVANWSDKAHNIRHIAATLNIGLDSLVFADDNPVERGLVRRELPMVAVPELPEDPTLYASCLALGGYFEGVAVTSDDRERGAQYAANAQREKLRETATDMASYLAALKMELIWLPFDKMGLPRVVQLANKTNQFNLATIRYSEGDLERAMNDPAAVTLQLRLTDVYGDNGIIGVILGRVRDDELFIETWLMSCRVLGRQVEEASLGLLREIARERGLRRLVGEYRKTAKNGMVREHYRKLGFAPLEPFDADASSTRWVLDLEAFEPQPTFISIIAGTNAKIANL